MQKTAHEGRSSKSDLQLAGVLINSEDTASLRSIQAIRIQRQFLLSLPTARVVAELFFQSGGRS